MRHLIFIAGILLLLINCSDNREEVSVDFSSVDAYFHLVDQLSESKMPSDSAWEGLFRTQGYKTLINDNNENKQLYRELIIITYYPPAFHKQDSILNVVLLEDFSNIQEYYSKFILTNLLDTKSNMNELAYFRKEFDFNKVSKESKSILKSFLPNPIDSLISVPKLNFACFEPDGYVRKYGIVLDLNKTYEQSNEELVGFFAHEMFHAYRTNFEKKDFMELNNFTRQIDGLMNEGIADLINKKDTTIEEDKLPEVIQNMYTNAFINTYSKLRELDSVTCSYLDGKISEKEFNDKMDGFFLFGGHPNGYYMTRLIAKCYMKPELIANFYNTPGFFRIYNQCAMNCNEYVFSDRFMNYMIELENKYFR